MGRIKELRKKVADGTATDEEAEELQELESEAGEETATAEQSEVEDEDQAIEEAAEKLASKAEEKLAGKLDGVLAAIKKHETPKVEVTKESKFVIDPQLGRKSVEELDQIKVKIPGREGKKHTEVTQKTVNFVQSLLTGDVQKLQVLVEGTGARGGFLVPEDFANILVEDIRDATVMRGLATVVTTTTDTLHIPNLAARPQAAFRSEGAVKTTSTVDFGETVLTPYSLATIVALSNELVADAQLGVGGSIIGLVSRVMSQSLAEREDRAFWVGNGSGQPTGVDNYTFTTVDPGAGASDSARADAIIQAFWTLPQGYRSRAVFVANAQTLRRIQTLKDTTNNYLLTRLPDSPELRLYGRPVYEQNDIPGGRIFLGDFSYYYIADREGISVATSEEATVASQNAFERNLTFVRVEKRVDGELTLTQPVVELQNMGNP